MKFNFKSVNCILQFHCRSQMVITILHCNVHVGLLRRSLLSDILVQETEIGGGCLGTKWCMA